MMHAAYHAARDDFHYLYDNHPMSHEGEPYPDQSHYLAPSPAFSTASRCWIWRAGTVTSYERDPFCRSPGDALSRRSFPQCA